MIDAATKETNLTKSLNAWVHQHLVVLEGLTVHYADEPEGARPLEWVDVHYLFALRRDFGRTVGHALGARAHALLNLNLCRKRETITDIYAMAQLRDKVIPYFLPNQAIPVRDYDAVGMPEIASVLCLSWQQAAVDDGRLSGVMVRNLSVEVTYTEAFTVV